MRSIYRIARAELANLFYSPVAWVLLIVFVSLVSMRFTNMLEFLARGQELGNMGLTGLSRRLFWFPRVGLWNSVTTFLYMLMPLLTMGVLSQEFNRGTFKLLYAAPISSRQIVLGKYLGVMLYGLLLIAILLIYVVISWSIVDNFEWRTVLTGLLGIYLLYGLYAALGIFMSSLTNYPIVSAIGMFALLTLLNMASGWLQEYAFFRELMYWLAMGGRTNTFIEGLISTEDVFYFILMSVLFLSFAVLKLQLKRESVSTWNKVGRYVGVSVVVLLLGYISSRPTFKAYYDATTLKENTLTKTSQEIVEKLDGGMEITTYVNMFDKLYSISTKDILRDRHRYDQYVRFKPEIKMNHVFYYYMDTTTLMYQKMYEGKPFAQVVKDQAKFQQTRLSKYLTLEELAGEQKRENISLRDEGFHYISLIERDNGQRAFLRAFADMQRIPTESEISAALQRLVRPVPKVGFLTGHGERSIITNNNRDYTGSMVGKNVRSSLLTIGFDFESFSLLDKTMEQLDSLAVLVIADPRSPFSKNELSVLQQYVERGGNLLLLAEPNTSSHLQPLMDWFGLRFEPGMLVQHPIDEYPANLLLCASTENMNAMGYTGESLHAIIHGMSYSIVMPSAVGIDQVADQGFKVLPLLYSRDSMTWNEMTTIDFVNDTAQVDQEHEHTGIKVTMLALERDQNGKRQRIIVMGDADCLSMGELETLRRKMRSANGSLNNPIFQWLSYGALPLDTRRPDPVDNVLNLGWENSKTVQGVLQWGLPILLFVVGAVLLIRRRSK